MRQPVPYETAPRSYGSGAEPSAGSCEVGKNLDFGTRAGVDQALSRLVKAGTIRRCGRGLYDIPRSHPWFGTLSPDPESAVRAMAARQGIELRPTGAEAANLLGLSEQVPAKMIYLTSGGARRILKIKNLSIELRPGGRRQMAMTARPTGLVVAALRSLGRGHITEARLARLHHDLPEKDRRTLLKDLPLAPAWMHGWLRYLATGKRDGR